MNNDTFRARITQSPIHPVLLVHKASTAESEPIARSVHLLL